MAPVLVTTKVSVAFVSLILAEIVSCRLASCDEAARCLE